MPVTIFYHPYVFRRGKDATRGMNYTEIDKHRLMLAHLLSDEQNRVKAWIGLIAVIIFLLVLRSALQ